MEIVTWVLQGSLGCRPRRCFSMPTTS